MRCLPLLLPLLVSLGCGRETAPSTPAATASGKTVAIPAPRAEDPDFVRARDVMAIVNRVHKRGGGFMSNARRGFAMHPERSRRGLLQVIEGKSPGWLHAFAFLRELPGGDDGAKRILRVFRDPAHEAGRDEAAWTLGRFAVKEAGAEILACLRKVDPKASPVTFSAYARGLAPIPPPEAKAFALELLTRRPLLPGNAIGPLCELLGRLDPEGAMKVLPGLLKEDWDGEGYRGVMRGLGAAKSPKALEELIAFVKLFYELQDRRDFTRVRRFGEAFYESLGEIARFDDERAWPIVLTHDFPFSNDTRDAQERVAAAVKGVPQTYIDRWAKAWARWPEKGRFGKRFVLLGEGILQKQGDPAALASLLKDAEKFMGRSRDDGKLQFTTVALTPWAQRADARVLALLRKIASRPGTATFSSREAAFQVLSKVRDPEYPSILAKLGDLALGWNRIDYPLTKPVPGLAEAFMAAKFKGSRMGTGGPAAKVFEALGVEGRPEVFAHLQKLVEADLANPKESLLPTWLRGLGYWKAEEAVPYLRGIAGKLTGMGVKLGVRHHQPYSAPARLQAGLYAAWYALAQLGRADGLELVYDRELEVLPNMTEFFTPPCFLPYVDRYPGPFKADWPALDAMKKRARS